MALKYIILATASFFALIEAQHTIFDPICKANGKSEQISKDALGKLGICLNGYAAFMEPSSSITDFIKTLTESCVKKSEILSCLHSFFNSLEDCFYKKEEATILYDTIYRAAEFICDNKNEIQTFVEAEKSFFDPTCIANGKLKQKLKDAGVKLGNCLSRFELYAAFMGSSSSPLDVSKTLTDSCVKRSEILSCLHSFFNSLEDCFYKKEVATKLYETIYRAAEFICDNKNEIQTSVEAENPFFDAMCKANGKSEQISKDAVAKLGNCLNGFELYAALMRPSSSPPDFSKLLTDSCVKKLEILSCLHSFFNSLEDCFYKKEVATRLYDKICRATEFFCDNRNEIQTFFSEDGLRCAEIINRCHYNTAIKVLLGDKTQCNDIVSEYQQCAVKGCPNSKIIGPALEFVKKETCNSQAQTSGQHAQTFGRQSSVVAVTATTILAVAVNPMLL